MKELTERDIEDLKQKYYRALDMALKSFFAVYFVTDDDLEIDPKRRALYHPGRGNLYGTISSTPWRHTLAEVRVGGASYFSKTVEDSITNLLARLRQHGFVGGQTIFLLEGPKAWVYVRGSIVEGECYVDIEDNVGYLGRDSKSAPECPCACHKGESCHRGG